MDSQDAHEFILNDNKDQDLDTRGSATGANGGDELDQTGVVLRLATSIGDGADTGGRGFRCRHCDSCGNLTSREREQWRL